MGELNEIAASLRADAGDLQVQAEAMDAQAERLRTEAAELDASAAEVIARVRSIDEAADDLDAYDPDPPVEPPDPPTGLLMSGPDFSGMSPGDEVNAAQLHAALGVAQQHNVDGIHTVTVEDGGGYCLTIERGSGHTVKTEKFGLWSDFADHSNVSAAFELELADDSGRPWQPGIQSKIGLGLYGLASGSSWPGGGTLYEPDWGVRILTSTYQGGALKWGLYCYSPNRPPVFPGWGSSTSPDGYRWVDLVPQSSGLPTPSPGSIHQVELSIENAGANQSAYAVLTVDGAEVRRSPMGKIVACNRVVPNSRYGGSDREGPASTTGHRVRDIAVTGS